MVQIRVITAAVTRLLHWSGPARAESQEASICATLGTSRWLGTNALACSDVEDNWQLGRIGDSSFDELAGSLLNMFDFGHGPRAPRLFLDPSTGTVTGDRSDDRGGDR